MLAGGQSLVPMLNLRVAAPELLVDITGIRHDATVVPLTGQEGSVDAAAMRLDEEARRIAHLGLAPGDGGPVTDTSGTTTPPVMVVTPSPARPTLRDDPAGWTREHWPLVAAVGAT